MTTLNKKTKQNINVLKTLQRVLQMRDRRHVAENTNDVFTCHVVENFWLF